MESRLLPLKAGWRCFTDGWLLFKKEPVNFLIGVALWLGLEFAIAFIPIAGPMIDGLIFPVLYAGFLYVANKVEQNETVKIKDFFVGFMKLQLLVQLSLLGIFLVAFELLSVTVAASIGAIAVAVMVPLAVIMVSALIFSVPLVLFEEIKFNQALKSSVACCGKNFAVIFIMYFILLAFMIISAVTYGVALILIIPITFCALYLCYRQAFAENPGKGASA